MNSLLTFDVKETEALMQEYEDVITTVTDPLAFAFHTYVPSIYDVVNPFADLPAEDACLHIMRLMHKYQIFFRFEGEYSYVPIKEVW